jgi:hypothetical protein
MLDLVERLAADGEFVTPGAENKATLRTPERKAVSANSKVQHFSSPTESTT